MGTNVYPEWGPGWWWSPYQITGVAARGLPRFFQGLSRGGLGIARRFKGIGGSGSAASPDVRGR